MDSWTLGCAATAQEIASGRISSQQLVETLIARAADHDDLNAFISEPAEIAIAAARRADALQAAGQPLGKLHGVPIAYKDNINVAGYPTSAGTPALKGHMPQASAAVVAALSQAGAVPFGKTNMHELAYGTTTDNAHFGASHNPFDHDRVCGGSSGGSSCAVSARLVPASIGTDTGGSVRIPAALCGLWGYRPSTGRWPTAGIAPISETRDTPGPLARCALDLALLDQVVTGGDWPLTPARIGDIRIGVPDSYFWDECEAETADLCHRALREMEASGATIIEVDVSLVIEQHHRSSMPISLYEGRKGLQQFLKDEGLTIGFADVVAQIASPDVREVLLGQLDPLTQISDFDYDRARTRRAALIRNYLASFTDRRVDVLAFPTSPAPAPLIGVLGIRMPSGAVPSTFEALIKNTDIGSNAGFPGINIPVGVTSQGLPVGLALDAMPGRDADLLQVAMALDELFAVPVPTVSPHGRLGRTPNGTRDVQH